MTGNFELFKSCLAHPRSQKISFLELIEPLPRFFSILPRFPPLRKDKLLLPSFMLAVSKKIVALANFQVKGMAFA